MSRKNESARLAEACERYLTRIENEGQSKTSITTAYYALRRFRLAVARQMPRDPNPWVHLISPTLMDDYCYGKEGIRRGIGATSFNRYRSTLNGLFEYAIGMRWCDTNPMQAIGRARPDAPKQRLLLNAGELMALPDLCATPIQRVAVAIGMNTGLRANDIKHLRVFDVSLAAGVIQTEIRKSRKLDVKPITIELHAELDRWLNTYAELMDLSRDHLDPDWYLVPSYYIQPIPKGKPRDYPRKIVLYPTRVLTNTHRLVQNPLRKLGYPTTGEGFHTLRRSTARAMFEALRERGDGRDHALMVVQDYLNHASTVQTQLYLGLSHERAMRDAMLKGKPFLSQLAKTEQERVTGQTVPTIESRRHG